VSSVAIKGWCPGALAPMRSGDGLVVRVRPRGGRIDARQATGIAELAARHGNGLIELTNRANLQIRGVSEAGHIGLIEELALLSLLDKDPQAEARRNILVTPFWNAGDEITSIADELARALALRPAGLPNKFGFAVDCGKERVLAGASADIPAAVRRAAQRAMPIRARLPPHLHPICLPRPAFTSPAVPRAVPVPLPHRSRWSQPAKALTLFAAARPGTGRSCAD
jgi:precorrin-3B synthase